MSTQLTAAKAQEFINAFKKVQTENNLSIAGEYYLQAMERVLPLLRAEESAAQDLERFCVAPGRSPQDQRVPSTCMQHGHSWHRGTQEAVLFCKACGCVKHIT